jgi:hypothetical protein
MAIQMEFKYRLAMNSKSQSGRGLPHSKSFANM